MKQMIYIIREIVLEFEIIGTDNTIAKSLYQVEEESLMIYGKKAGDYETV